MNFSWSKGERTGEDRRLPTVETRTYFEDESTVGTVTFCRLLSLGSWPPTKKLHLEGQEPRNERGQDSSNRFSRNRAVAGLS